MPPSGNQPWQDARIFVIKLISDINTHWRKYCRQNQLHCPELFYICDLNICIFRFAQEDPPPIYKTREKDDRPLDLFVSLNADDRVFLPY
jgi:hypothetical protein